MAISDWPEDERPRERLLALGAEALSDAELLAIFLRVGVRGKSAVDLARDLLAHFDGSLGRLAETPPTGSGQAARPRAGQGRATGGHAGTGPPCAGGGDEVAPTSLARPAAVRDWLRLKLGAPAARSALPPSGSMPRTA